VRLASRLYKKAPLTGILVLQSKPRRTNAESVDV